MLYTTPEYWQALLAILEPLEGFSYRPAMGDYYLEYKQRTVGGVFGNRFLIKITPSSLALLAPTAYCIPYAGAKEMLLVEERDPDFIQDLLERTADDLPEERSFRDEVIS